MLVLACGIVCETRLFVHVFRLLTWVSDIMGQRWAAFRYLNELLSAMPQGSPPHMPQSCDVNKTGVEEIRVKPGGRTRWRSGSRAVVNPRVDAEPTESLSRPGTRLSDSIRQQLCVPPVRTRIRGRPADDRRARHLVGTTEVLWENRLQSTNDQAAATIRPHPTPSNTAPWRPDAY